MAHLRAELLLREENYNKHFKNGGAGEKVLSVGAALNAQVVQQADGVGCISQLWTDTHDVDMARIRCLHGARPCIQGACMQQ